jgi:hypothetical protein
MNSPPPKEEGAGGGGRMHNDHPWPLLSKEGNQFGATMREQ